MDLLLYVLVPVAFVALGVGARVLQTRLARHAAKLFCARLSTAAFGSAIIVWTVYVLASLLNVLVILVTIAWFTRRVFIGRQPSLGGFAPSQWPVAPGQWLRLLRRLRVPVRSIKRTPEPEA